MAKGLNLSFVADVRGFLKGTTDIEGALDKVTDSLDDVAREGQRAGDDAGDGLATGLKRGGRDAKRALEDVERAAKSELDQVGRHADDAADETATAAQKMERSFRESLSVAGVEAKKAGDDIGTNTKRGFDDASEGAENLREEAGSTAREVAASFDGSAESIAGGFQEVAANAFAGFGPAGAAAGLAAAAGIGLVMSAFQRAQEEALALAEAGATLARDLSTGDAAEDTEALAQRWEELKYSITDTVPAIEFWRQQTTTNIEAFATAIDKGVLSAQDLHDAFNDPDPERRLKALREALEGTGTALESNQSARNDYGAWITQVTSGTLDNVEALREEKSQLEQGQRVLEDQIATLEAANRVRQAEADALGITVAALDKRRKAEAAAAAETERAAEIQQSYVESLEEMAEPVGSYEALLQRKQDADRASAEATAAATEDSKDSWQDYTTSVGVSIDELIADLDAQIAAAQAFETNLATIAANGGQALADELRAKGPEVAGAVAEVIATAGPEQQRTYIERHGQATGAATADAIGKGARGNKTAVHQGVADSMAGLPTGHTSVEVEADTAQARRDVADFVRDTQLQRIQMRVDADPNYSPASTFGPIRRASGGYIEGEGSDIDDQVHLRASPGEYVLDKQAVDQIGVANLNRLNEGQALTRPTAPAPRPQPQIVVNVNADAGLAHQYAQEVADRVTTKMKDAMAVVPWF